MAADLPADTIVVGGISVIAEGLDLLVSSLGIGDLRVVSLLGDGRRVGTSGSHGSSRASLSPPEAYKGQQSDGDGPSMGVHESTYYSY